MARIEVQDLHILRSDAKSFINEISDLDASHIHGGRNRLGRREIFLLNLFSIWMEGFITLAAMDYIFRLASNFSPTNSPRRRFPFP
ncbi:hypothetical protein NIES3974_01910 [Calothrix sp. NIES-3974]|nr:hypothetical protein NIES3974_01910 [Calothrix sp. NIES-3974]